MSLLPVLPLTKSKIDLLLEIYSSKEDYLRNLERKTKINPSLLHRILKELVHSKIISPVKKGQEVYYSLTPEQTLFWAVVLEEYFRDKIIARHQDILVLFNLFFSNLVFKSKLQRVYLFGSFVNGEITPHSDIDLLFVSNNRKPILNWCRENSIILGRKINPLIYTPSKFAKELEKKEALLTSIVANVKNRIIFK